MPRSQRVLRKDSRYLFRPVKVMKRRLGLGAAGLGANFAGATGPRPASGEGKLVLTTAPWSQDHGDGNTRRFPLRSAVEGVSQEVRERRALPHPAS